MSFFLNEEDLNDIKGLMHYLNHSFNSECVAADVHLIDSNGETIGIVKLENDFYRFFYGT